MRFTFDAMMIGAILASLGNPHIPVDANGERITRRSDSQETATFNRKLEYVLTRTYDKKYPDLKARLFLPVNTEIPTGAESFVWRAFDYAGMAKIIANFADDLPLVDVIAAEVAQKLKSVGDGYSYSIQDLRASAMAGTNLDTKRASAARKVIDNTIEQIAAIGNSAAGLPGFLNNANVTVLSAPGDIQGNWPALTPKQILADLNAIVDKMVVTSKEAFKPNTLLLPTSRYRLIASTTMSDLDQRTILDVFLANSPDITNVDSWTYLETADTAGTGPRAVAYNRDPEYVELVIPQEFEQLPPQAVNLAFKVPCHARIGGVVIYYPLSVIYADGI